MPERAGKRLCFFRGLSVRGVFLRAEVAGRMADFMPAEAGKKVSSTFRGLSVRGAVIRAEVAGSMVGIVGRKIVRRGSPAGSGQKKFSAVRGKMSENSLRHRR